MWTLFINNDCDDEGAPRAVAIEADKLDAIECFKLKYGIDPQRCHCCVSCGTQYTISAWATLNGIRGRYPSLELDIVFSHDIGITGTGTQYSCFTYVGGRRDRPTRATALYIEATPAKAWAYIKSIYNQTEDQNLWEVEQVTLRNPDSARNNGARLIDKEAVAVAMTAAECNLNEII